MPLTQAGAKALAIGPTKKKEPEQPVPVPRRSLSTLAKVEHARRMLMSGFVRGGTIGDATLLNPSNVPPNPEDDKPARTSGNSSPTQTDEDAVAKKARKEAKKAKKAKKADATSAKLEHTKEKRKSKDKKQAKKEKKAAKEAKAKRKEEKRLKKAHATAFSSDEHTHATNVRTPPDRSDSRAIDTPKRKRASSTPAPSKRRAP